MADAAYAAEDTTESYYVDQLLATGSSTTGYEIFCQDLDKATKRMDLIIQEAIKVKEQNGEKGQDLESTARVGPGVPSGGIVKMVGLDEELLRLMDQLTSDKSSLQILPIVGMGGIGKTTLARNLFEHPYVKNHFHIQAWVTISQDYTVDKVIHSLLSDLHVVGAGGEKLYKHLCGRKYLIILDDIWDDLVWNEIRRFFPDNNNGSRILITTRISTVAVGVGSCSAHEVKLLDDKKSWDLLSETVFGQQDCPHDLLKCGEKIAKNCKGLPLTIAVVGGLLKAEKTLKYWENVATDLKSLINTEGDGHCLKVVSLSYYHLPIHLKPCFLYMATYREDQRVGVCDLTRLWVADGFLKPQSDRTLEEVAQENLDDLIDRNLIKGWDREISYFGEIRRCCLHDLLREFCVKEAREESFLYQENTDMLSIVERLGSERRLILHLRETKIISFPSVSVARSLICAKDFEFKFPYETPNLTSNLPNLTSCRLLRVLNTTSFLVSDADIRYLVNLRYLECQVKELTDVPRFYSLLFLFWNLETLVIDSRERIILPPVFWELRNLGHVSVRYTRLTFVLAEPTDAQSNCVLESLQTLFGIVNLNVTGKVIKKIPELKSLEMAYDWDFWRENLEKISSYFTNLARLNKLEFLSCYFAENMEDGMCVFNQPKNLTFSHNLRQLELQGSNIPWEHMTIIGSLPKLEDLRLALNAFCGEEWNSTEGDFQCLKYLEIWACNLWVWRAESSHFPRLIHLNLTHLDLEEIPSGIGEVESLQSIKLFTNQMSAVNSGKAILDERQSMQGDDDDLVITGSYFGTPDEKWVLDSMASSNFRVQLVVNDRSESEEE